MPSQSIHDGQKQHCYTAKKTCYFLMTKKKKIAQQLGIPIKGTMETWNWRSPILYAAASAKGKMWGKKEGPAERPPADRRGKETGGEWDTSRSRGGPPPEAADHRRCGPRPTRMLRFAVAVPLHLLFYSRPRGDSTGQGRPFFAPPGDNGDDAGSRAAPKSGSGSDDVGPVVRRRHQRPLPPCPTSEGDAARLPLDDGVSPRGKKAGRGNRHSSRRRRRSCFQSPTPLLSAAHANSSVPPPFPWEDSMPGCDRNLKGKGRGVL